MPVVGGPLSTSPAVATVAPIVAVAAAITINMDTNIVMHLWKCFSHIFMVHSSFLAGSEAEKSRTLRFGDRIGAWFRDCLMAGMLVTSSALTGFGMAASGHARS
jgi:hypothetical protein